MATDNINSPNQLYTPTNLNGVAPEFGSINYPPQNQLAALNYRAEQTANYIASVSARWQQPQSITTNVISGVLDGAATLQDLRGATAPLSKFVGVAGKIANTYTGVTSTMGEFSREYYAGEHHYRGTMKKMLGSVLQTSSSYIVGTSVAGATAAALGGAGSLAAGGILAATAVAVAPVALGLAAALGVGYGVGKLVERL